MNRGLENQIKKLIKHNRRMIAAEMDNAQKTGLRHYPNKSYFKALKKQKRILESMALSDMRTMLHALYQVSDELTRPKQLKPSFIDRASKEEAIEMVISMRYLHEFLDEILHNARGDSPTHL